MPRTTCSGLPADWLNGWLAAVGTTVLDSRIRLHWTTDSTPRAVLAARNVDPTEAIVESWPDAEMLNDLPIAENWNGAGRLQRKVKVAAFAERARAARGHRHSWTLSSTMTDLCVDEHGEVAHAPLDPAGPGTIKWLHHRLMKVHLKVEPTIERIRDSFEGRAVRVQSAGLGFDQTRLGSLSDKTDQYIDPVIETLVFFGLAILPMRADGVDDRLNSGRRSQGNERQRGWDTIPGKNLHRRLMWPAWGQPLDCNGIDALMDVWKPEKQFAWTQIGIKAGWQSKRYTKRGDGDRTVAFGAEPL